MKNKIYSLEDAVKDIPNGAVIMVGGIGGPGDVPQNLLRALAQHGAKELTVIANSGGLTDTAMWRPGNKDWIDNAILYEKRQVRKLISAVPFTIWPNITGRAFKQWKAGELELELVAQGTLALRIRAGGGGIPAFYTPTGVGTALEQSKEKRTINGREYLLEYGLTGDYALVRAHKADKLGNLVYRLAMRTFNTLVATACKTTIVEVDEIVEPGELDIETIVTPAVYVDRIVKV